MGPLKRPILEPSLMPHEWHTLPRTLDHGVGGSIASPSVRNRSQQNMGAPPRVDFCHETEPRAHTVVVVKLLLPPRQSRGVSGDTRQRGMPAIVVDISSIYDCP